MIWLRVTGCVFWGFTALWELFRWVSEFMANNMVAADRHAMWFCIAWLWVEALTPKEV